MASLHELLSDCTSQIGGDPPPAGKDFGRGTSVASSLSASKSWVNELWQPEGITILGTPIGSAQYISTKMGERIAKEQVLWEAIPTVPDLQCAWQCEPQSESLHAHHAAQSVLTGPRRWNLGDRQVPPQRNSQPRGGRIEAIVNVAHAYGRVGAPIG